MQQPCLLPYDVGNLQGTVVGADAHDCRSGWLDSSYRFFVNLKGGPATDLRHIPKWQRQTLIGVSLKMVDPAGQHDPNQEMARV